MELLQGSGAVLRIPEADGDPIGFDSAPAIQVVRDSDGAAVSSGGVTQVGSGESAYWQSVLSPQSEVDRLTATWTGDIAGVESSFTTFHEVVGGFVVSLAAIEAKLGSVASPNTAELFAAREQALREIEDACGAVVFRPRYEKERLHGDGSERLLLANKGLLRVIRVEVDEVALSEAELEALTLDGDGIVIRESGWQRGAEIVVSYAYGLINRPDAIGPVRDYAAYLLTPAPKDRNQRATSESTEQGTYSLVTAGVRGAQFPLPAVNAFVERFPRPVFY